MGFSNKLVLILHAQIDPFIHCWLHRGPDLESCLTNSLCFCDHPSSGYYSNFLVELYCCHVFPFFIISLHNLNLLFVCMRLPFSLSSFISVLFRSFSNHPLVAISHVAGSVAVKKIQLDHNTRFVVKAFLRV